MATVAKVAVQAATYAIDKVYDYLLPPELAGQVGCRVLVPFGRGNRLSEAVILSLRQEVPDKPLKAVRTLLDEEPILTEKELRLTLWMTRRYFCTFYDALRTVLPTAVWYHYRETWTLVREPEEPTAQEAAVCRLLQDGAMSTDKLRQALGDDVELLLRRMARAGALRCDRKQNREGTGQGGNAGSSGRPGGGSPVAGGRDPSGGGRWCIFWRAAARRLCTT